MWKIIGLALSLLTGCAGLQYQGDKQIDVLQYNYQEKEWKYAAPDAPLRFNYYERKYEFAR